MRIRIHRFLDEARPEQSIWPFQALCGVMIDQCVIEAEDLPVILDHPEEFTAWMQEVILPRFGPVEGA